MANYQELLSKAVAALPENNGAARRDVYEKARKALVAQLRAINPPLPAREITQHRLELEDCIREVEHNVTEEMLVGLRGSEDESIATIEAEPSVDGADEVKAEAVAEISADAKDKPASNDQAKPVSKTDKKPDSKSENGKKSDDGKSEANAVVDEPKESGKDDKSASDSMPTAKDTDNKPVSGSSAKTGDEEAKKDSSKDTDGKGIKDSAPEKTKGKSNKDEGQKPSKFDDALDQIIAEAEQGKTDEVAEQSNSGGGSKTADSKTTDETNVEPKTDKLDTPAAKDDVSQAEQVVSENTVEELAQILTTQSDKGVGAAMSRVREVDNGASTKTSSLKSNAAEAASRLTSPLEGAGIVGVGGVSNSTKTENEATTQSGPNDAEADLDVKSDDAQSAVDRAIETLDREARGEGNGADGDAVQSEKGRASVGLTADSGDFNSLDEEEKSGGGLTIFLVLVILLLGAVGGGGYWAWKEGFVDLGSLFASTTPSDGEETPTGNPDGEEVTSEPVRQVGAVSETTGPGNTTTDVETPDPTNLDVALVDPDKIEERLPGTEETGVDTGVETPQNVDVAQPDDGDLKAEDRLVTDETTSDPALTQEGDVEGVVVNEAAQSLLLEASTDGSSGAVPFSGTVEWQRGLDELGEPTLIGNANIPARNMNVKVLFRRNADPSLPASHLMEIDFDVSETFSGGAVAGLPGILLKNEELVQGVALVGASARVVGNSFLFALSAAEQDVRTNLDLLENRKWLDLAMIYASGNRAIITLEKDDAAQALFSEVLGAWATNSADATGQSEGAAVDAATEAVSEGASAVVEGATELLQDAVVPAN